MRKKGFQILTQPVKTFSSMAVGSSSSAVQEYDAVLGEFYPDRSLTPLVLVPTFGYIDQDKGTTVANAAALLTNGHWFRLDSASGGELDSTTEITAGGDFLIDSTAGSATYGQLTVKENTMPENPVTYVFTATLVLPSGESRLVKESFQTRSRNTETIPVLSLDNEAESLYNPFEDCDEYVINPVMRPAPQSVSYAWKTMHSGTWGALGSTRLDWAVEASGNGVKIHRHVMPDQILLKCVATVTVGTKQTAYEAFASVTRRIPAYEENFFLSNPNAGDKTIAPSADIKVGKGVIVDPMGELVVKWYNSAGTLVGTGMKPVIQLSALGGVNEIEMRVTDPGGWKALVDGSGKFIIDASGKQIIAR